jgi:hypothetical protein
MFVAKNLLWTPPSAGSLIVLDGIGTGFSGLLPLPASQISWTHVVTTSGATIFFDVATDRNITLTGPIINGSTSSTAVDSVTLSGGSSGNAYLKRFKWVSTSAGSFTITLAGSVNSWAVANSVSYTGVTSIGTAQTTTGTGTSVSASATCSPGQLLLQSFIGESNSSMSAMTVSGGTNRYNVNQGNTLLAINDATTSTTFTGSGATGMNYWGSLAHALTH